MIRSGHGYSSSKKLSVPQPGGLAEGEVVDADVEHARLRGRGHRLHEEARTSAAASAARLRRSGASGGKSKVRSGDRGRRQTERALSPPPDDLRPAVRDAAAGRRSRAGLAAHRRARPAARARTRSGSSCCASASRSTPTRPSSASRFRHDPLLGPSIRHLHGLRPLRTADRRPRAPPRRVRAADRGTARALRSSWRSCAPAASPRRRAQAIGALSPAQLRRLGLATHRASTLVRVCRTIDLEAPARPADRGRRGAAPPRARPRAVVARGDRARRARQLAARAGRRSRPRQALLGPPRPVGRAPRDRRIARAVRRMGRVWRACI